MFILTEGELVLGAAETERDLKEMLRLLEPKYTVKTTELVPCNSRNLTLL